MEESQDKSDPRNYQQNCEDFNLEVFCRVTASVVAYRENVVALEEGMLFHIFYQYNASVKKFFIEPLVFFTDYSYGHCHRFFI